MDLVDRAKLSIRWEGLGFHPTPAQDNSALLSGKDKEWNRIRAKEIS